MWLVWAQQVRGLKVTAEAAVLGASIIEVKGGACFLMTAKALLPLL